MTIDYQKKEMTLRAQRLRARRRDEGDDGQVDGGRGRASEPTIVAPGGRVGLRVDKEKDDEDAGVAVKEVLAGGAAAAGRAEGRRPLLTLDGRWTDTVGDTFRAASQ